VLQRLPLLDLALSGVWAKMDATEGRGVTFSGGSFASCDYLNRGLGQWEPLLERWGCGLWVRTDAALGDLVGGVPGRLEAEVGSRERLNVNVSCAMFDVVMGVLAKDAKRWLGARVAAQAAADESVSGPVTAGGKDARDGEAFHPLWIKNETGQALVLESVPGPVVTAGAPRVAQHVNAGATQPVTCVPLVTAPSTGAGPGLPQVSLRQLRVFLAAAAVPGRPGWSSTGEKGEPDGPDGPESLAVMEGCIGEGRQTLQGLVDLDAGGPQVMRTRVDVPRRVWGRVGAASVCRAASALSVTLLLPSICRLCWALLPGSLAGSLSRVFCVYCGCEAAQGSCEAAQGRHESSQPRSKVDLRLEADLSLGGYFVCYKVALAAARHAERVARTAPSRSSYHAPSCSCATPY
jgi:hypothetical protein